MTSPAHLAVVHVLNDHNAPHAEHLAAQILDALRAHGWRPPPTAEPIPPAGHSTAAGRRLARQLFEATRAQAREEQETTT